MMVKMADTSAVSIVLFIMFSGGHVSNHQDRQNIGLDLPPTQDAIVEDESVCSYIRIPEHEDESQAATPRKVDANCFLFSQWSSSL